MAAMHYCRRWLPLNLLLLAGILVLLGMGWRRNYPAATATGGGDSCRGPLASPARAGAAVNPARARAVSAQPVVHGRGQMSLPRNDLPQEHDLLRASGWESLPCLSAIEFSDQGDAYVIMLSADNVALADVRLRLEGAVLTVLTERSFGAGDVAFRRFMLPAPPDSSAPPQCSLTNGALRIRLAKRRP
jgi:hypothetical protein